MNYVRPKKQVAVINNYRSYNDKCMVEEVTLHMEGLRPRISSLYR